MIFEELPLAGAHLVHVEQKADHRGYNARVWCTGEFAEAGLVATTVQTNVIYNKARGTLRGMHYQVPPFAEAKLFRLTRGAIHDVIVDLRPGSRTYLSWFGVDLRAGTGVMLYVPPGFGQGFLTLEDDTELTYQVSAPYSPQHGRGFRHDDPIFNITWPAPIRVISDQDRTWPDYKDVA
jgi:dTDP-4-dehydrorhamnose 3,5-epimerase